MWTNLTNLLIYIYIGLLKNKYLEFKFVIIKRTYFVSLFMYCTFQFLENILIKKKYFHISLTTLQCVLVHLFIINKKKNCSCFQIMSELVSNGVQIYQFPTDDDTVSEINSTMNVRILPLHLLLVLITPFYTLACFIIIVASLLYFLIISYLYTVLCMNEVTYVLMLPSSENVI